MKKHLIAAAALATLSTAAFAQSATVYGIFDMSVGRASNVSGTQSKTGLNDAVWMPSVFGITGTEDLGGGLKASFNLESDVNVDTGALSAASGTKLFGRKANVNLSGGFGTLTAGKDIDMIFLQGFIDNVRNSHSASGFMAHTLSHSTIAATAVNGSVLGHVNTESVFTENTVRYTTPTFGGVKASVQHRFGEQAGQASKNTSTAFLVNYSNAGLSVSAGQRENNDVLNIAGADVKLTYLGATYQMGDVRLSATHHKTKFEGSLASTADLKTSEFGVGYAVNPKLTAAVNYVKQDQGANEGDITSASLKYSLSKRTSLWTLVSKTNYDGLNAPGANYVLGSGDSRDSTSYSVGITHSF